jgi:two-component system sensor histidine kinase ChiS
MALYPRNADDSLKGAIAMQKEVAEYNIYRQKKERKPIRIGVGVHTGNLMLGIIGDQMRMDAGVVADAVNTASRMEGLTKHFGASIIASEVTLSRLENVSQYNHRFLGKVLVKGRTQPLAIFDVYDGDTEHVIDLKHQTKSGFDDGLRYYFDKDFASAIVNFKEVLKHNPDDKAAKRYLERSAQFVVQGVPENWDGVERMLSK